jgi:hypothetical protein
MIYDRPIYDENTNQQTFLLVFYCSDQLREQRKPMVENLMILIYFLCSSVYFRMQLPLQEELLQKYFSFLQVLKIKLELSNLEEKQKLQ